MAVDKDTVRRVAALARLGVADDRLDALTGEIDRILDWVAELDELDTEGVRPMTAAPAAPHQREDEVTEGGIADRVLANAPQVRAGMFAVPRVVE